jgi:imidazolonepropionase-like amidohydrolase
MITILRGATVIDGTGRDPIEKADLAIDRDRIAELGQLGAKRDAINVDATGLTVLPGFIDAHTHLGASVDLSKLDHDGTVWQLGPSKTSD